MTHHVVHVSAIAAHPTQGEWQGIDGSAVDQLSTLIWQVSAASLLLVAGIIVVSLLASRGFSAFAGERKIALATPLASPARVPSRFMAMARPRGVDVTEASALLHATPDLLLGVGRRLLDIFQQLRHLA